MLLALRLPPSAQLFTADATSMYTNIKTHNALRIIEDFLRTHQIEFGLQVNAIIEALTLIMKTNVFQFGDTY